jgi:hypothetical protein
VKGTIPMVIANVTKEQIEQAAILTGGIRLDNFKPLNAKGDRFNVKLSPNPQEKKWLSQSGMSGRKKNAINWYGFAKFFSNLYQLNPNAIVKTAYTTYQNEEEFRNKHYQTQYRNIGSIMYPVQPLDECLTDSEGNLL